MVLRSLWLVFVDAVMPNVLVFAVGQVFAWLFLRSGRFWLGAGATLALWTFIDWWLVSRYLLGTPAEGQLLPLLSLQVTAVATTAAYLWARIRKRLAAPKRADRFRMGIQQLLSGKLSEADTTFRQLAWVDPWDPSAWIARGDACRRLGVVGRARRCYRRAGGVDVKGDYRDLLAHRLKLLHNLPSVGSAQAAVVESDGVQAASPKKSAAKKADAKKTGTNKTGTKKAKTKADASKTAIAPAAGAVANKQQRAPGKGVRKAASGE